MEEVLRLLGPRTGECFLDLTVGAAGHADAVLERLGATGLLVGVDRDREILALAEARLRDKPAKLFRGNFGDLEALRPQLPTSEYDGILLDLGVSSLQLDEASRGFSFRQDGPLDMRMNSEGPTTARDLVRDLSVEELAQVIRDYGEERHANRVARAIDRARKSRELTTTGELASVVRDALPKGGRGGGIDPATRTFQALRIAVNRELEVLDRFLSRFDRWLRPGGRLAIMAYHSLEDRRVKRAFKTREQEGDFRLLTRRALRAPESEIAANPRARSVRLRGLIKLGPAPVGSETTS